LFGVFLFRYLGQTKQTLILWIKRILGFSAIGLWISIIYTIAKSPAPFMEQAPYCMGSTMLIFGFLSLSYKGLEYWSLQNKK
jgi:peptidoglycan/LPS O-acetylase OafA/YrhL